MLPSSVGENTDSHKETMSGTLLIDRSLGETSYYPPREEIGGFFLCIHRTQSWIHCRRVRRREYPEGFPLYFTLNSNRMAWARAYGMERPRFTVCVV